jgi:hypothetical protein
MISISYGTQTIVFEVQRETKSKNTYITVERDKGVIVKAPEHLSNEEIKQLVKKKAAWIIKKLEALGSSNEYGEVITGSRLFYLGKSYYVELIQDENHKYVGVIFIHSKFKIYTPLQVEQLRINEAIEHFYKQRAQEKITTLVSKWSKTMNLLPEYIGFKKSNTKWGSCSERNRLSFNPEVMKLSSSLIEYVVVHELAHIAYKNHSKEFWSEIKKYISDYSSKEEELKVFEKRL